MGFSNVAEWEETQLSRHFSKTLYPFFLSLELVLDHIAIFPSKGKFLSDSMFEVH